jgi:hypothetical protein
VVENTLPLETDYDRRVAMDRGTYPSSTAPQTPPDEKCIFDAEEEFRPEDLYLDIGVGD